MNRLSKLRETSPDTFAQATAALVDRGAAAEALAEARQAYSAAAAPADRMARALLSLVCQDLEIPLTERAGWSMAFHGDRSKFATVDEFAEKAREYQAKLEAIDAVIRPAGTPILAINPGPVGDYHRTGNVLRYALTRSSGDGLELHQAYNDGQDWHYHWVNAPEQAGGRGRTVYRGFDNGLGTGPVISNMTTDSLVAACAEPAEVARQVRNEHATSDGFCYVIGEQALAAFFEESVQFGASAPFDMLRGAVAFAGISL